MKIRVLLAQTAVVIPLGVLPAVCAADAFIFEANDTPMTVPRTSTAGITESIITVPSGSGSGTIQDMNVFVDLDHSWVGDLTIQLEHVESGTLVTLQTQHGISGNDITEVTYDDEATGGSIASARPPFGPGEFVPLEVLSAFDGESLSGTWKLVVVDHFFGDMGELHGFRIEGETADADYDGDGVENAADLCPDTVIPEAGVPSRELKPNRFALVDGDTSFDTILPGSKAFNVADTGGCSCEQIIDRLELGKGHSRHGCTSGTLKSWISENSQE